MVLSNTAGGINTGWEIFRVAIRPTSSISRPQTTRNIAGKTAEILTEGRHAPIICPRIVPGNRGSDRAGIHGSHRLAFRALRGFEPDTNR